MNEEKIVSVKSWHAVFVLVTWLVLCSMAYARLDAQGVENQRRIEQLEQRNTLTIDQYNAGLKPIEQRLERIERKLDDQDVARSHR